MLLGYGAAGDECRALLRVRELLVQLRLQHREKRRMQGSLLAEGKESPGKIQRGTKLLKILREQVPHNAFEV